MKTFSNLEAVLDRMQELGFFINQAQRDERQAELTDESFKPHAGNEFWFSNGGLEVKIFKQMFGAYELCNFRGLISPKLDELFELAEIPKKS